MTEPIDSRVAVYIDFDNIVISRYDQVHGRSQFMRDKQKGFSQADRQADPEIAEKLNRATVDIGAVIDFASSFGTLVLTRAYADWSAQVNADYRGQLVSRAVDLVQLFPAAAYAKNGADIRLAVDAVEDMFRLPDLTHVVIVAGDSDYIALAQRCKRLGRYVVGIGVAGSTSRSLAAACDEFATYDALPGVKPIAPPSTVVVQETGAKSGRSAKAAKDATGAATAEKPDLKSRATILPTFSAEAGAGPQSDSGTIPEPMPVIDHGDADDDADGTGVGTGAGDDADADGPRKRSPRRAKSPVQQLDDLDPDAEDPQDIATGLLERALRLGHEKDDADWLHSSNVKTQMKRMDPSFSEKALGFRSFSDFIKSRDDVAELDESTTARLVRLAPSLADED
ncbi:MULTISPECIES: NYN domain-containing protein [unclassified Plantibacter]|uniref:NYN domain-containing protein n=1 Tax=unclassified Plantibacter TaxID=2624265 RepID=UPI003D353491